MKAEQKREDADERMNKLMEDEDVKGVLLKAAERIGATDIKSL